MVTRLVVFVTSWILNTSISNKISVVPVKSVDCPWLCSAARNRWHRVVMLPLDERKDRLYKSNLGRNCYVRGHIQRTFHQPGMVRAPQYASAQLYYNYQQNSMIVFDVYVGDHHTGMLIGSDVSILRGDVYNDSSHLHTVSGTSEGCDWRGTACSWPDEGCCTCGRCERWPFT